MKHRGQLNRRAQRRGPFAPERSHLALVNGGVSPMCPRDNLRSDAQWQSRALHAVLLAAPIAFAAASGANSQTVVGPGTIGSTVDVNLSNSTATVVGNTIITVPGGDGIDAPSYNEPGGILNINTKSALAPPGPISITSGGTGVASIFPDGHATISINSGPSGDVTIASGGAAIGISGDTSLTAIGANGGHLMLESTGAFGVVAQFGATISLTGATITANSGVGAVLIGGDLTNEGAIGNLTNVDIVTTDAVGLDATRTGTIATMTGGSITVTGANLTALYSDTNGVTNATNVKITTTGDNTYGAFAEATIPPDGTGISPGGGTIHITGGSITTQGMGAFGVFAQGQPSVPSTITLNNSMLTTNGDGAVGYRADGAATISATNTSAVTTGAAASGGMLSNGATVMISGGSVKTTGAGSFGFLVQPFTPTASLIAEPGLPALPFAAEPTSPNVLQISNATVTSTADAFHVTGAVADVTVSGSTVTSGNGVLLNTLLSGTTTLTATGSQLTGAITTDSSSTADVTLRGNTTWTMTGSSNLTNLVNDPSNIVFSAPVGDPTLLSSYKTLTVTNYTGMGGGITLNTFLGGDGSPSDELIISRGSATGSTGLTIHNTTGPGEETTANGIQVVNAIGGATTATGAFTLANPELRAGAFDYDLFRGGVSGGSANDWFLRSNFIVPPIPPEPPIPPVPPEPPIIPPDPPPHPLPPGVYPIIGPELATYGVVQPLARELGVAILGTLDDRVGDTYQPDGCAVQPAVAPAAENSCGRPADQEAGGRADQEARAGALSALRALGLGPLLRTNGPQPLQRLRRSQRRRQSGRLPGRHRPSARLVDRRPIRAGGPLRRLWRRERRRERPGHQSSGDGLCPRPHRIDEPRCLVGGRLLDACRARRLVSRRRAARDLVLRLGQHPGRQA